MRLDRDMRHEKVVEHCYSYYEAVSALSGISDYTDGMYHDRRDTPYEAAQAAQAEYLLDEARVGRGTRLLDIGCGRGRIVEAARARGAEAVGVTISPEQVRYCRERGSDVRLLNYKDMGPEWDGRFDAVIANGSLEHFVSKDQGLGGQASRIYRELFELVHRLLDSQSESPRFVTTAIHHRGRHGQRFTLSTSRKLFFMALNRVYGGWYPLQGQLEHCAEGLFEPLVAQDGTIDYLWTSEDAWRGVAAKRRQLGGWSGLKRLGGYWSAIAQRGVDAPLYVINPLLWTAQFRGDPPPVILLRHTWEKMRAAA